MSYDRKNALASARKSTCGLQRLRQFPTAAIAEGVILGSEQRGLWPEVPAVGVPCAFGEAVPGSIKRWVCFCPTSSNLR